MLITIHPIVSWPNARRQPQKHHRPPRRSDQNLTSAKVPPRRLKTQRKGPKVPVHLVEEALAAAVNSDNLHPFRALNEVLQNPFELQSEKERYETGAPDNFGPYITYCGT